MSFVVVEESCFIPPLRSYPEEVSNEENFFLCTVGNAPNTSAISGAE